MKRKERKRARKNNQKHKGLTEEEKKSLRRIAKYLTMLPRDKSKDNKTFFDGKFGCYNLIGKKIYCSDCYWLNRNCQKRKISREKGTAELWEKVS